MSQKRFISQENIGTKILLVDDDPICIKIHEQLLRLNGIDFKIRKFYDGDQLLSFMSDQAKTNIRYLIFLDLNMPNVSGFEVLHKLEEVMHKFNFTVAIVSSSVYCKDFIEALEFNFVCDFIQKPLKTTDIGNLCRMIPKSSSKSRLGYLK